MMAVFGLRLCLPTVALQGPISSWLVGHGVLRLRHRWPSNCAPKQADKLAAVHSITSSAPRLQTNSKPDPRARR